MKKFIYNLLVFAVIGFSCDSELELEEPFGLPPEEALNTSDDYERLLNSAYDVLRGSGGSFLGGRSQILSDLLANTIDGTGLVGDYEEIYRRSTGFFNGTVGGYYKEPYIAIYRANTLLQQISNFTDLSENELARLKGESLFIRGLCHLDVLTLFAQPYGFTTDNSHPGVVIRLQPSQDIVRRSTFQESYDRIEQDLLDAMELLENGNDRGHGFATEWACKALLARLYFYNAQYDPAYSMANDVIENGDFTFDVDLFARFSQGISNEGIFTMPSLNSQDHRGQGLTSGYRNDNGTPQLSYDDDVVQSMRASDLRNQWFTIANEGEDDEEIYLNKFNGTDYFDMPVIHLTELKLIRAESAAQLNENLSIAISDINDIRFRAYGNADNHLAADASAATITAAARYERRIEMVAEGNYLHDQKRIGVSEDSGRLINGALWSCPGLLLEFPALEAVEGFESNNPNGC